jgi:hypothetical protein
VRIGRGFIRSVSIAIVGTGVACAGCSRAPSAELQSLSVKYTQAGVRDLPAGVIASEKIGVLCTTGDPVTIDSIDLVEPTGGLRRDYWAIQPNEFTVSPDQEHVGDVTGARFPVTPGQVTGSAAVVTARCPDADHPDPVGVTSQVLVTVVRSANVTAATTNFVVRYTVGGESRTTTLPYGITLCAINDRTTIGC